MPEAYIAYNSDWARVPRTLFAHGHTNLDSAWPTKLYFESTSFAYVLIPDNWNGLDALYAWLLGGATEAITMNVTVDLGTCTENYNNHTQTVNGIAPNMVLDKYTCVDLTTTHAAVLANLAARDMIRVSIFRTSGESDHYNIGIELQET